MKVKSIDVLCEEDTDNISIQFDDGEFVEMKELGYKYCQEFLGGAWRQIEFQDFVIKKVGGGLTNMLYHCSLPDFIKPEDREPYQVLLRIYGPVHDGVSVVEAHFTECLVCAMLSEKKRGPRLYGVFPSGRLEEYIPARSLRTDELLDKAWSSLVAEAAAQLHKMTVPLSKEPKHLWSTMGRWLERIEHYMTEGDISPKDAAMVETLTHLKLRSELEWLKEVLTAVQSPVVFSHNDLQEGNILKQILPDQEKSVTLIDFEYCGYNYRAYDIANHFCEFMYDYSNKNFPYFWAKPHNFPTKERQTWFARKYLSKFHNTDSISEAEIEKLLAEVNVFLMAPHLFWGMWSVVMGCSSTIAFDHWGYGHARFSAYLEHKRKYLQSQIRDINEEDI